MRSKVIMEQSKTKITLMNNTQELLDLLDIILELRNKALTQQVITRVVLQTPYENVKNILKNLLTNKRVNDEIVRQAFEARIDQLDIEKNAQHRNYLFQFIDLKEIINEKLSEKIIDKLRPLLASNNKENQLFALKCLDNLENLPRSKKDLLKALLREIKTDKWQDEEKDLLDKINKGIE